jgi:tRNA (guanine-N7-)-methyltransferase
VGKDKLKRFDEMEGFTNVFQPTYQETLNKKYRLYGKWNSDYFKNENPIVLELGCGKGEYTVGLAEQYPDKNFIGIDIKGARMWKGAKKAFEENMNNAAFIRTRIEFIESFFAPSEVSEIWITFPDPQLKKIRRRKRLTSARFLNSYREFLKPQGFVHLKTDSQFLHEFTKKVINENKLELLLCTNDLYNSDLVNEELKIKTYYESGFLEEGLDITYLKFRIDGTQPIADPPDDEE